MNQRPIILWDLDGPILYVADKYYQVYCDLVREHEGCPVSRQDYWEAKRTRVAEQDILRDSGVNQNEVSSYRKQRRERIETAKYLRFDTVWPGARAALDRLKGVFPMALVTLRWNPAALEQQLMKLGIRHYFESVLSSEGSGAEQDRASCKVRMVQSKFGTDPLAGWFVGDTETDLRAAKQIGTESLAVTFGIRDRELLLPLSPTLLIDSPDQLECWAEQLSRSQEPVGSRREDGPIP